MREHAKTLRPLTIALATFLMAAALLSLGGCGQPAQEEEISDESIVLYVKDDTVLMADIQTEAVYFPFIPEGALFAQNGDAIEAADLVPGDIVVVTGNGAMAESYPAQYPGITRIQVIGFDDSSLSQYDYIVSRVFAEADPNEVPSASIEYDVEDIGNITVAVDAYAYTIEGTDGTIAADGAFASAEGVVFEGVPDMVISDTDHATVSFTADVTEAVVTCIPTADVPDVGLVADLPSGYSIPFELDPSSLSLTVEPGHLYNLLVRFDNGEASYAFIVK